MSGLELAPRVIVRVASLPLGAVQGLDDAELAAALARDGLPEGAPAEAAAARYDAAIERGRRRLWARTVDDPRFMRALALVNPSLAASLVDQPLPPRRNKAARHLETTLYRYLARGVSRTEPCALWSGATLARWGTRRRIRPRARREARVAPDLGPFRAICQRLSEREPYRDRGPFKLNPTLVRDEDGRYRLWSGPGRGPVTQRALAGGSTVDRMVTVLRARATWSRREAAAALIEELALEPATAHGAIERLVTAGVLTGGFAFPRRFRDPWQALQLVESWLEPPHARAWARARERLETRAGELAGLLDDGAVPALLGCLEAARSAVAELARALGLEALPLPRAALRCDVAAPWEVELGPDDARAVRRTLRSFTRHHDRHGIQGPLLRAATRHMLGEGSSLAHVVPARVLAATDGPASWGELADALGREPELRERCERAARHLARDQAELRLPADGRDQGPSLAALHASPTARSGDGLLVHGLGLDATASYARLADLLDATDPTREGLGPWFRRQHHRLAEHTGVDVAVLLHDHGVPNVMAQPELGALVLDPWGVTPGQLPDRGLRMRRDPERVAPLIEVDGHPRPLVAYAPTAAAVPFDDPCLQALLLSSGHVPPLAAAGTTLVHEPERGRPRHSPRLCLPDDTVVRPRSTWLEGEALRALTRAKSLARFARWQALAAEHQWPRLVTLERDAGPALLVDRDSPLAIEAAFEGTARARRIKVQELLRDAWIGADDDDDDRRYLADLVLPFVRDLDPSSLHVDDDALDPARRGPGAEAGLAAAQ